MAIDRQMVEKAAHLARLAIDDNQAKQATDKISAVLKLIDEMQSVNTDDIEPLSHPLDAVQRLRPDLVTESNQREKLQQNAPAVEGGLFLVPKVID